VDVGADIIVTIIKYAAMAGVYNNSMVWREICNENCNECTVSARLEGSFSTGTTSTILID